MEWTPVPLETLLDVNAIVEYWRQRGLAVHRTPALQPFPDITQPEVAFPRYPLGDLDPSLMTRCGSAGLCLAHAHAGGRELVAGSPPPLWLAP